MTTKLTPVLAACLALGAAGCGGSGRPAVPDVRGRNVPDAIVAVYKARLCVQVTYGRPVPSNGLKEPVLTQSPAPGTRVQRWSLVRLTARLPEPPSYTGGGKTVYRLTGKSGTVSGLDVVWGGPKPPCPPVDAGK